jgi:SAM-dependent methyltransferase
MSEQHVNRDWVLFADQHGTQALEDGEPTRWFEEIWSAGARREIAVPWDRDTAYPPVLDFVDGKGPGVGRRAVVVGAGLGADAELLAAHGYSTVAFDIAPSAVELARRRHPDSAVTYRVADLLDLPSELVGVFDLVIEVFTVQAMPRSLRSDAVAGVRRLLAPGGEALVIQFVRPDGAVDEGPPWLLDRTEMESFAAGGVHLTRLGIHPHPSRPEGAPIWVGVLRRR